MLEEHQLLRIRKLYRKAKPQPAYRSKRPLGIPAIRDRVAQMAFKLVIDADGSKYFDSILQAKLMAVLAERIVDGALLHIIRIWLKAPVVGEDEDGTRRIIGGGKANTLGTPQGGVISPLLANLYLHLLDRLWERQHLQRRLEARLVRYADDFVYPNRLLYEKYGLFKVPTTAVWTRAHALNGA